MNLNKIFQITLGTALITLLFSGCYTQFGLTKHTEDYEDEAVYEEVYDEQEVVVYHHYVPRPNSVYFYYDPIDYWYYEPGIHITYHYHRPHWVYPRYPVYVHYPYPYPYPYWHHPPKWHHYPNWHYPPHYGVYIPGNSGSRFGRRPSSIARRQRDTSSGGCILWWIKKTRWS